MAQKAVMLPRGLQIYVTEATVSEDPSMYAYRSFPGGSDGKEAACNTGDMGFDPWVQIIS